MSFNALHSLNALIPMLFTELGIMMDSRLQQYWKALCLMEVTVLGILTDSRFVQSENRPPSMVSKEFGRMTDLRFEQPANVYAPIAVTVLGMSMLVKGQPTNVLLVDYQYYTL